jgi:hypothetical protein
MQNDDIQRRDNRLPNPGQTTPGARHASPPKGGRNRRLRRRALALAAALTGALAVAGVASATPSPTQQVDLRVLLLSGGGSEPGLLAWQDELRREGTPFDTIDVLQAPPITAATLASGAGHARYQAVVMADDVVPAQMTPDERTALQSFEATFGVRQIDAFAFPSAEEGLTWAGGAGTMGSLGSEATLTAAGKAAFPYLSGRVSFDQTAWGYTAAPAPGASVSTLLSTPSGGMLQGIVTWPDGRQEMVSTVSVGPNMIQGSLLLRGDLAWATENVGLGMWRSYFAAHIDDVFLPDDRWDTVNHVTHEDEGATIPMIRMKPADVTRAANWSAANGIKLDFAFNGAGMDDAIADNGSDALSTSLLANRAAFRWINHTYSHLNLNTATQAEIQSEITQNRQFATRNRISISGNELVTGEHSGLGSYLGILPTGTPLNPALLPALRNTGIAWLGDDASVKPAQRAIGVSLTIPRYPSNIYYNVGTRAEQLDEYNWIYFGNCVNTAVTTCLTKPATWDEYVNSEASIMLRHLLGNDPRPHYMHQANLAEDGTFYPIVDEVLNRYRSYFNTALVNPTMTATGTELSRQASWAKAIAAGTVTASRLGANVLITNAGTAALTLPVTGTGTTATYGGERSQWVTVPARSTLTLKINTAP